MKSLALSLFSFVALVGCASSIDNVDVSGKNQACVRQCTGTFSNCVGGSTGIGAVQAQNACASGYRACAKACPDK